MLDKTGYKWHHKRSMRVRDNQKLDKKALILIAYSFYHKFPTISNCYPIVGYHNQ